MCNIQVTFSQHTVLAKPNICLIKVENCICILITWVRPIYLNPQKGQFFLTICQPLPPTYQMYVLPSENFYLEECAPTTCSQRRNPPVTLFPNTRKGKFLLTLCSDTWYRWYLIQIKLFYQSLCHLIVRRGFHSPGGVFLLKINPEGGLQKNCNWK